mgnify:FL=1
MLSQFSSEQGSLNLWPAQDHESDAAKLSDEIPSESLENPHPNAPCDQAKTFHSLEQPFYESQRYHPPFQCLDSTCKSCHHLPKDPCNPTVENPHAHGDPRTLLLEPRTDYDAFYAATRPPMGPGSFSTFPPTEDANATEKSSPMKGIKADYSKALGNVEQTYPGTTEYSRPPPKGIEIPPCWPRQKVNWWIRTHSFLDTDELLENTEDLGSHESANNGFLGPIFNILFCLLYFSVMFNLTSPPLQVLISLLGLSHAVLLYTFDAESFSFFYQDCFQSLTYSLGFYIENMFTTFSHLYTYISGKPFPSYLLHALNIQRLYTRAHQWPYILFYLFTVLRTSSRCLKHFTKRLLEAIYLFGFYYPKMSSSCSLKQLHNVKLKGLPQVKTKTKFQTPRNKGVPVHFEGGLPFVYAHVHDRQIKFLVDTGSAYNILNKEIVDQIRSTNPVVSFEHPVHLCGHSGQPLSIEKEAVKIPMHFFDGQHLLNPTEISLPFLVESNPGAVNILGMNSLRKLELSASPGFRQLFLSLNHDPPPVGTPIPGSSYPGTIRPTCDTNQVPYLDIRFPDLALYSGCVVLNECHLKSNSLYSKSTPHDTFLGRTVHVHRGQCIKPLSQLSSGPSPLGTIMAKGALVPCSHHDPDDDELLAELVELQAEPFLRPLEHVDVECEKDSLLFDAVFHSQSLNPADPDSNPLSNSSSIYDLDLNSTFDTEILVPKGSRQATAPDRTLEIQIQDNFANCILCLENQCKCSPMLSDSLCPDCSQCRCTQSDLKHKINERLPKKRSKVFTCENLIILSVLSLDSIPELLPHLVRVILQVAKKKNIANLRLGNILGSTYGPSIFARLSQSLSRAQAGCTSTPLVLIPTAKQSSVHALEFDVGKGQLVHKPHLMNDQVGLDEEILQPPEVSYILNEYSDDLSEVIQNSHSSFQDFLQATFSKYSDCYVHSPTDYGELKLDTFRLDLEIMDGCENLLPKHHPFPTNAHITKVCDKVCSFWEQINLAGPSEITSHASRLLVVTKKVSQRAFELIKKDVEQRTPYRFKSNSPSELYSIDPDFLTVKQINQVFRICLDSRDLNRITRGIVQRSQNPETTIFNLMMCLGGADPSASKSFTWSDFQKTDPFKKHFPFQPDPDTSLIDSLTKQFANKDDRKFWYSTLDISSAHTSVPLTDRARQLLNFITPSMKIMQFQRAVFGLKNISSQFNGSLCRILEDLISLGLVHVYADDVILITLDRETHLALIAEIARRFNNHGLKISLGKSNFGVENFTYLGFLFDQKGITLSQDRINALTNFPTPIDLKGVQRFLGAMNYIQKFIPQYSFHLFPISQLLSAKEFYWNEEQEQAFQTIKNVLKANLRIHYVPPDTQLHLFVDSSLVAGGGVLFCGKPGTPSYRPILYMSKKYSNHEIRRHSALEAEMHNLIYCLTKCEYFFTALDRPVQVHTDAKTVMYLIFGARKTQNPKLARLALKLSNFLVNFKINYAKPCCPEMKIADCLSRQYYQSIPKLPGDLVKVIQKEDIYQPEPGIYSFEELDNWIDDHTVINEKNYPEKILKISDQESPHKLHQVSEMSESPEHFSLIKFIDYNKLGEAQRKDPKVAEIYKTFTPKELLEATPKNGYLFFHNLMYVENKTDPLFPKLYVPDPLLPTIVAGAHIVNDHIGAYKHYELLNKMVSSPNLKNTVFDMLSKCHLCAVVNCDTTRKAMIDDVRTPDYPGQTFSIDFMTVQKDHGFNSILVIMDLFSNFCVLEPCKDQSTDSAVKALDRAFHYIGSPEQIRADGQKSLLKSKIMKKFLKKHRVQPEVYPPHYKYHNASVERQIRNIRSILRTQNALDSNFKWYKNISNTMTVLNAIPRKFRHKGVTRFLSPFEIFFGRKRSLLKIDDYDNFPMGKAQPSSLMASSLRNFTRGAILALKRDYQKKHNEKAIPAAIKPGDFYLVQNHKTPQAGRVPLKYQPRYLPNIFLCKKIRGKNVIGIDIILGNAHYCSLDHVKLYKPREDYFSDLPEHLKKHFGSSLDLKLSLDARQNILEKLKKLGMYQNIIAPAETLSSPEPPSSTASGTQDVMMQSTKSLRISDNKATSSLQKDVPRDQFVRSANPAPRLTTLTSKERNPVSKPVPDQNLFQKFKSKSKAKLSKRQRRINQDMLFDGLTKLCDFLDPVHKKWIRPKKETFQDPVPNKRPRRLRKEPNRLAYQKLGENH